PSLQGQRDVVLEVLIRQPSNLDLELVTPPEERGVPLVVGQSPLSILHAEVQLGVQRMPVGRPLRPDQDPVDLSHCSPRNPPTGSPRRRSVRGWLPPAGFPEPASARLPGRPSSPPARPGSTSGDPPLLHL